MAAMRARFRAIVATAVLFGSASGQGSVPEKASTDPLLGDWEGCWSYPTGMDEYAGTFQFHFHEKSGRVLGQFLALERKHVIFRPKSEGGMEAAAKTGSQTLPPRTQRIRRVQRTSMDPPKYRWEVDGSCWNVVIHGQEMAGVWNGGRCSVVGIGSGARLIQLQAKRLTSQRK